jgi:hypothetical protein
MKQKQKNVYCVSADAYAYIEADSPEEAEQEAECLDSKEWDIQNISSCTEPE